MKIAPFGVEIWMNDYETRCRYNLAETCTESLTVDELLVMTNSRETLMEQLLPLKLTYGAIEGSDRLRAAIAALYQSQTPQNVLVTHGAIGANSLAHQALLSSGDHVVSVVPAYQQHYSIPEAIGAVVDKLRMREDNGFMVDVDELAELVRPRHEAHRLTNPNNPTGALMGGAYLDASSRWPSAAARTCSCDEVYRGTDYHDPGMPRRSPTSTSVE